MKYFVLTTRGFEKIAETEILQKLFHVTIEEVSYRKVTFDYQGDISDVESLRSVEDAFLFIGKIENVWHIRESLSELIWKILKLQISTHIPTIQSLRNSSFENFSISASSVGRRNFSYIEIKEALNEALSVEMPLSYEDESHEWFDIRVFLEHSHAYIWVRLTSKPLHRRSYKVATTKATLRGDVAYTMAYLVNIQNTDTILDPMCGSGTILAEACAFNPFRILGGDISSEAVEVAIKNLHTFDRKVEVLIWDSKKLPLENASIDKIISNLPFGKQIKVEDLNDFYISVLDEFKRVLKPGGLAVFLTSYASFSELIPESFVLTQSLETNLNGEVVYLNVYKNPIPSLAD